MTCHGENVPPPLSFAGVPEGTRFLALVVDDPDAPVGTFTHWVAWGIDPAPAASAEGQPAPREGHDGIGTPGTWSSCLAGSCPIASGPPTGQSASGSRCFVAHPH